MKIIKIISSFLLVGMFGACLKSTENNFLNGAAQGTGNTVSFVNVTSGSISNSNDQSIGITLETAPSIVTFYVQQTSSNGSYPANTVTIDTTGGASLINTFNVKDTNNITGYTTLPDSTYKWLNTTATVDPTTHLAAFKLQIQSTMVDLNTDLDPAIGYALGIKIKSCSSSSVGIASNLSTKVILIKVRNQWDADYTVTGYFFHPTAASCRAINMTKTLSTVSIISCSSGLADLEKNYGYRFQFSINTVTNKLFGWVPTNGSPSPTDVNSGFMTADNPGNNNPNYTGANGFVAKTYNNTYDPAKFIFWMHFGYVSSGGSGQNSYGRQIYEKWVRN
ncbi:MAG: DUF1735 domain-containing protein [Bacteroidota bacterium]